MKVQWSSIVFRTIYMGDVLEKYCSFSTFCEFIRKAFLSQMAAGDFSFCSRLISTCLSFQIIYDRIRKILTTSQNMHCISFCLIFCRPCLFSFWRILFLGSTKLVVQQTQLWWNHKMVNKFFVDVNMFAKNILLYMHTFVQ